jgi:predicted RNA binding protein YcfA (HicA-like mRNA interferase family)
MPTITHIQPRLTYRYVDGYSNLDEWGDEWIWIKILGGKRGWDKTNRDMAYNGWSARRVVILPPSRDIPRKTIEKALADTFNYGGCAHSYDCCGCPSAFATIRRVGRHEYYVHQEHTRNY